VFWVVVPGFGRRPPRKFGGSRVVALVRDEDGFARALEERQVAQLDRPRVGTEEPSSEASARKRLWKAPWRDRRPEV
jgi:hypothetical protein